jgi:histidyl-tRNA synthetase
MKAADQRNARFVLVLGDNEVSSGTAELKRMSDGSTSSVTLASLVDAFRDLSA